MGPLSGIGDSFSGELSGYCGWHRYFFAQQGNILGMILYFTLYTAIHFILNGWRQNMAMF